MTMSETRTHKGRLELKQSVEGEATLLRLAGPIDETFSGFDPVSTSTAVLELSGLTRITSYGVRQWIRSRDALSQVVKNLYYVNCPPFFIDQLNMVLNFGGNGQVITAYAPFSCGKCRGEQWARIDIIARHDELVAGQAPSELCPKCQAPMEMDELPETYFGFVRSAGARSVHPAAAALLQSANLYTAGASTPDAGGEARLTVQKLVHDRVTFFRFDGAIDRRFRARSLLEGIEGEVVLDLAKLTGVAEDGREEWDRLRGELAKRASQVTLVDLPPSILDAALKGLPLSGAVVYSIAAPHKCDGCGRDSVASIVLGATAKDRAPLVCRACGGANRFVGSVQHQGFAAKLPSSPIPAATREVIERREDLLSRARIEAEAAAPDINRRGVILGKYEIVRAISVGGMAEVFLAVQKGIGGFEKPVALKRIRRSVLERRHFAVAQFLNEAKIAATLTHPNISQIFDVGEEDGLLYLAMEYVHGRDLRLLQKRLRERSEKLPLPTVIHIVQQIARALHHAYSTVDLAGRQLKVIHRDVTPHNILCAFDGTIKLVDFGVATSALTAGHDPTQLAGKHNYVSPEQLAGQALDARSDLFSLGVVLYELLAGERPFQHESREATLAAVQEASYTPLSKVRSDLPAGLDAIVEKLLARKPTGRFADGNTLAEELGRFAQKHALPLSGDWLRATLPGLFPIPGEVDAEGHVQGTQTPRSDSFSLSPIADVAHMASLPAPPKPAPLPPATAPDPIRPAPSRGTATASTPSKTPAPALDDQTMSQLLEAPAKGRSRLWLYLLLLIAAAGGAAVLWLNY